VGCLRVAEVDLQDRLAAVRKRSFDDIGVVCFERLAQPKRPALGALRGDRPERGSEAQARAPTVSAASCATSVGVVPTRTPWASSVSFFACAVPEVPEMMAPA
jgi:hypothetical protein